MKLGAKKREKAATVEYQVETGPFPLKGTTSARVPTDRPRDGPRKRD